MEPFSVDRLFRSTKCVELGTQSVTVHALSDMELQERHRRALEASMRLSRALKNPESGEYLSHLEPIATAGVDVMKLVATNARRRSMEDEVSDEIPFVFQPFPDNATLEEQAATLEERTKAEAERKEQIDAQVKVRMEAYQKELGELQEDKLRAEALRLTTELIRQASYTEEFVSQTIYLGTKDVDGQSHFKSASQASLLSRPAREMLWNAVQEVNGIDPLASKSPSSTA